MNAIALGANSDSFIKNDVHNLFPVRKITLQKYYHYQSYLYILQKRIPGS